MMKHIASLETDRTHLIQQIAHLKAENTRASNDANVLKRALDKIQSEKQDSVQNRIYSQNLISKLNSEVLKMKNTFEKKRMGLTLCCIYLFLLTTWVKSQL